MRFMRLALHADNIMVCARASERAGKWVGADARRPPLTKMALEISFLHSAQGELILRSATDLNGLCREINASSAK
jgi:hypothetical protein